MTRDELRRHCEKAVLSRAGKTDLSEFDKRIVDEHMLVLTILKENEELKKLITTNVIHTIDGLKALVKEAGLYLFHIDLNEVSDNVISVYVHEQDVEIREKAREYIQQRFLEEFLINVRWKGDMEKLGVKL